MKYKARSMFVFNLKKVMNTVSKTQTQIAKEMNVPLSTVSSWINGHSYPRVDSMQKLADVLEVSMKELTDKEDNRDVGFTKPMETIEELTNYLLKQPILKKYYGHENISTMSDEEKKEFSNRLEFLIKLTFEHKANRKTVS